MFLVTRGIKPADVLNLEPGATPFPESVIDMLAGGLGQPVGGWPKRVQEVVLGKRKPNTGRPGEGLPDLNLKKTKAELAVKLKRDATDDDLYSHFDVSRGLRPVREVSAPISAIFRCSRRRFFSTA